MVRFVAGAALVLFLLAPLTAGAGTVQLPQTGQTTCYRGVDPYDVVPCPGTGQDGNLRAGAPWPSPRFTDNGDDTMTDRTTWLVWPKDGGTTTVGSCTGGSMTWHAALTYVTCLNGRGYLGGGWRLPNVNELESLVNAEQTDTATWLNGQGFRSVKSYWYWSSTSHADVSHGAWIVVLWDGNVGYLNKSDVGYYVWPVRAGQ